jgi:hypothetical protein
MGPCSLSFEEYVFYRFYDPDVTKAEEKRRFIGNNLHWRLTSKVSDVAYDAVTQDKFVSYSFFGSLGFPIPQTLAVVTSGTRIFPGIHRISDAQGLADFITSAAEPLFFKLNRGIGSWGAFICNGEKDGKLITTPYGALTASELMQNKIRGRDFLVQRILPNHSALQPLSSALATVRTTNFFINGQLLTPICIVKLASGANIADNFWREGNMLADLDPETGRINRVIRGKGMSLEVLDRHPSSGIDFRGFQIPFWNEVRKLNRDCALAVTTLPFTSTDIAVTDSGPVLVEMNTGGDFFIPQLASGRGFLTPEIAAFFGLKNPH